MASSGLKCFVNKGIIFIAPDNISSQDQQDVQVSLLFSQLGADKSYQRENDPENWFNTFDYILQNLGWAINNSKFEVAVPDNTTFVLASVVLNEIQKNTSVPMSADEIDVFRKSFNVIHRLPDDDDVVSLFYNNNYDMESKLETLILASMEVTQTKDVVLKLVMFGLQKNVEASPRFLLHVYDSKDAKLDSVKTSNMVLNGATFDRVRQVILEKVGDQLQTMIKQVPILPEI